MKKIFSIIVILIVSASVWGQNNSLYFTKNIFESTQLNPARQPNCKVTIGLPVLSQVYLETINRGITFSDLYTPMESNADSFYYNLDNIYDNLYTDNYFMVKNKVSLGYLGFWVSDFYVTLGANLVNNFGIVYPQSLFVIKDGNYFTDGRYISASNFAVQFNSYTEFAIGVSKEVIPGLTVGGKIKILNGISNIRTNYFNLDWRVSTEDTATYDYNFIASANIQMSNPAIYVGQTSEGLDSIYSSDEYFQQLQSGSTQETIDAVRQITSANKGIAFDFGVIYKLQEKFEFSASVTDLGFINWNYNPIELNIQETDFTFSGVDLGKYIGNLGIAQSLANSGDSIGGEIVADMLDTLLDLSDPTFIQGKYRAPLNTNIHFGASYSPVEWATVGALYSGYFFNKKLLSSYTLSGTVMFWRGWSYTLSYTAFKKSFNNVGMGLSYKIGPFQTYLSMDNISIPMLMTRWGLSPDKEYTQGIATNWVKNTKLLSLNFGVNFVFGCRDRHDFGLID